MVRVDDRTPEQMKTHPFLIVGTDSSMSGWGGAEGGVSYAAWAYEEGYQSKVLSWVANRGDMKRVREVYDSEGTYRPKGRGHLHIYVVDRPDHPAIR